MAKFTVTIDLSNAAFADGDDSCCGSEIASILAGVVRQVDGISRRNIQAGNLRDINGNVVGRYGVATSAKDR